jgi:sulfur-carrier protein adenylyltransferase/sulfurtransferase
MDIRKKVSLLLILLSIILALLPLTANRSFSEEPSRLLAEVLGEDVSVTVDEVAEFIVMEDPTVILIDLRPAAEYSKAAIPGALNVPWSGFIESDPDTWLSNRGIKVIFYSTGNLEADYALVYSRGMGYDNCFIMEGGIKEWIRTVIETKFSGERITARENALFETRRRAGEMYTEYSNLPDSLKAKFLESRKFSAKKLDGGCE